MMIYNHHIGVINPAFDMTPPELISGIITEKGVAKAPYEESIKKLFQANLYKVFIVFLNSVSGMSTVSAQAIEESLKQCMDPEVPLNIVEMGLIYGIDVTEDNDVNIKMTMTTQGCPLHETLVADATRFAKKVPGVNDVKIDIVWEPAWSMDKMTEEGKLKLKEMGSSGLNTPAPIIMKLHTTRVGNYSQEMVLWY